MSIKIILLLIFSLTTAYKKEKVNLKYFVCFNGIVRQENLYVRELISYYLSIGFKKFIFVDNNIPTIEKLSNVI